MIINKSQLYASISAVLLTISTLSIFDVYLDVTAHLSMVHAVLEMVIILLCLAPALYFLRRWLKVRHQALNAEQQLHDYLDGVGRRIEEEFRRWNLTETEKRTAIYILKGMSHREIASKCHRSEGTVRQHAVAVYRKAGLASRAEFSAHFLQLLLAQVSDEAAEVEEPALEATPSQKGGASAASPDSRAPAPHRGESLQVVRGNPQPEGGRTVVGE